MVARCLQRWASLFVWRPGVCSSGVGRRACLVCGVGGVFAVGGGVTTPTVFVVGGGTLVALVRTSKLVNDVRDPREITPKAIGYPLCVLARISDTGADAFSKRSGRSSPRRYEKVVFTLVSSRQGIS